MTTFAQALGKLRKRALPILTVFTPEAEGLVPAVGLHHPGVGGLYVLASYYIHDDHGNDDGRDSYDPGVHWIPRTLQWENFELAGLHYPGALRNSAYVSILAAIGR